MRKQLYSLLQIPLIILLIFSCSKDDDSFGSKEIINWEELSKSDEILIGSHRGLSGYPENTYLGIKAAIDAGYKIIEFDIAKSKDGVYVIHHDETIDRCSNGTGYVKDYTLEELRLFDFSAQMGAFTDVRISTLDEILELCKENNVAIELDLSNDRIIYDEYTQEIYEIVERHGMVNQTLFCGNAKKMEILTGLNNEVNIDPALWQVIDLDKVIYLRELSKTMFVSLPLARVTSEFCKKAHDNNILVELWTCINSDEIEVARENGADYVLVENILNIIDTSYERTEN